MRLAGVCASSALSLCVRRQLSRRHGTRLAPDRLFPRTWFTRLATAFGPKPAALPEPRAPTTPNRRGLAATVTGAWRCLISGKSPLPNGEQLRVRCELTHRLRVRFGDPSVQRVMIFKSFYKVCSVYERRAETLPARL